MPAFKNLHLVFAFVLVLLPCLAGKIRGQDLVTVLLADGRQSSGKIHEHTDRARLWLLRQEATVDLVSGFWWDQVKEGWIGDQHVGREELQEWSATRKQRSRTVWEIAKIASQGEPIIMLAPAASKPAPRRVKTLVIRAYPAQWNRDALTDGLRISVAPLDSQGQIVPVNGQIEFTLVVEIEKLNGGQVGSIRPEFRDTARKNFIVKSSDFVNGPAYYELPFDHGHPEFDVNIGNQGLVHARLSIPGQGVFEASDAQVTLREFSRFRDQLQYFTPSRYLPIENIRPRNR